MTPDIQSPAASDGQKPVILVVDDDPNNLAVLRDCLVEFNYIVLVAEDGESAIQRANYAQPNLILLDIMMPRIDGYETCRRLKAMESTKAIPVIFMTALAETEHKVKGLEAGAVDYITKPFQREELQARIAVHLHNRELTKRLQEANELLEARVEERTAELAGTNKELQAEITKHKKLEKELFAAKKMEIIGQLTGGVAHEVRNPLNAILSIFEALFKEREIANNPEYQPYLEHIRTQVNRLSKLMADLLELGKPLKPVAIRPLFLDRLCIDIIKLWNLTHTAGEHPVTFIIDPALCNPSVFADGERLQQAIFNLMENAAQCSPKGSGLLLRIVSATTEKLHLQVVDCGSGIAPEKLDRVFEPFYTLRKGGTGLGLTLVKHFVESMGGEIRIRNNTPLPGCTAELILDYLGNRDIPHESVKTSS
ncbi:MAG: response regulator [Desulfoprunum sp.]|nr:response regulator [Desulfoprunum sp.]